MTIKLQISDAVYASLLKDHTRVQGTIALVNPTEGNFNAHHRNTKEVEREYIKLPHGTASVTKDTVRLTLNINRDESYTFPSLAILSESAQASDFVLKTLKTKKGGAA